MRLTVFFVIIILLSPSNERITCLKFELGFGKQNQQNIQLIKPDYVCDRIGQTAVSKIRPKKKKKCKNINTEDRPGPSYIKDKHLTNYCKKMY